jgi:hypothetical protein
MIKKNKQSYNRVQLEIKRYPAKPVNRDNQGYLSKLANQVIEFTKFNNLVFSEIIFYLTI